MLDSSIPSSLSAFVSLTISQHKHTTTKACISLSLSVHWTIATEKNRSNNQSTSAWESTVKANITCHALTWSKPEPSLPKHQTHPHKRPCWPSTAHHQWDAMIFALSSPHPGERKRERGKEEELCEKQKEPTLFGKLDGAPQVTSTKPNQNEVNKWRSSYRTIAQTSHLHLHYHHQNLQEWGYDATERKKDRRQKVTERANTAWWEWTRGRVRKTHEERETSKQYGCLAGRH